MPELPARNRLSIILVLVVQALNSFNDNFVKMLLISLAITVGLETWLGRNMELLLPAIFSVPYILFGPLAGWLSDRRSKKQVIVWMQVMQIACFIFLGVVIAMRDVHWSLLLGLVGFFVLATQAAVFSPAKMGILKELAGSRRLGMVSGALQMTMMAGVLGGFAAGGYWFKFELTRSHDAWWSALLPLGVIGALCIGELIASTVVQRTPDHPSLAFNRSLWWEHFGQVKLVFRHRPVRLAAIGIIFFWFISNSIGMILVTLAKEMHPDVEHGGGPLEIGILAGIVGLGVVAGSMAASAICRRRIELGILPLAGLAMGACLVWAGLSKTGTTSMYVALIATGLAGGLFMVPLYAYVQDRAAPEERARILAGINLLDCTGVVVVALFVLSLKSLGLTSSQQLLVLALPAVAASVIVTRLLPQDLVRFIGSTIIRMIYKIRSIDGQNVPRTGGVLMLPNHVSYVDALVIAVACDRPVRFVMWDTLYKVWWMNGFLRLFGTVPISPSRAKDAVRTVADALKAGECVCLFPEGQLTRLGLINEIRKGFELMVRQSGAPVVPVYVDGLWGSIFSFEGGGVLKKLPKKLRYPVTIFFGEPIAPEAAKADALRETLLEMSSRAFLARKPDASLAEMNQMRVDAVTPHEPSKRYVDAATGAVIAVQLPDPVMPETEINMQLGTRTGTLGRLLPGLAAREVQGALLISGLAPNVSDTISLPGAKLDAMGFVIPGNTAS